MFYYIETYGDLKKVIEDYDLEDKKIVIGVEGFNSYCFETNRGDYELKNDKLCIQDINDFIVLSDECGSYEEDLFRQEQLKEEEENDN